MNETIERLARAATIEWQESPTHCVFKEIFAKVVARECLSIVQKRQDITREGVCQEIRERFEL